MKICKNFWKRSAAGRENNGKIKKRGRGAAAPAEGVKGEYSPLRGLRGRAPSGVWGRAPSTKARRRRGGEGAEPPSLDLINFGIAQGLILGIFFVKFREFSEF